MRFSELKDFSIVDWDGEPFMAYVCDNDEEELARDEHSFKIVGYMNGRWYDSDGYDWKHVYKELKLR